MLPGDCDHGVVGGDETAQDVCVFQVGIKYKLNICLRFANLRMGSKMPDRFNTKYISSHKVDHVVGHPCTGVRVEGTGTQVNMLVLHASKQEVLGTVFLYIKNHIYLFGVAGEGMCASSQEQLEGVSSHPLPSMWVQGSNSGAPGSVVIAGATGPSHCPWVSFSRTPKGVSEMAQRTTWTYIKSLMQLI